MHILRELGRNLARHPGTVLGSILSLTLLFVLFDLFWIGSMTSENFYRTLLSDLRMELYLPEEVSDSSITAFNREILSLEEVFSAEYISKDVARSSLEQLVGYDLLIGYDSANPLPRSIIITVESDFQNVNDMDLLQQRLASLTGSTEIVYSRHWLEKAENTRSIILQLGLLLGGLILLTILINSANNIRLMARARARGFRQMALLGAGRIFVGMPFFIEGFLMAGTSAALGWLIILYGRSRISLAQFEIMYPPPDQVVVYCVLAGLLGLLSGYVGIRKLLKN